MTVQGEGDQSRKGARQVRLRALAHPLRWRLLDLVSTEGSVTATRCAQVLGESVASCSYHLGILRKYGYLEAVPGIAGREKPWRPTTQLLDDMSVFAEAKPAADESAGAADEAAAEAFVDHQAALMKARLRRYSLEPEEWQAASLMGSSLMFVTATELNQINEDLVAVLRRFEDRAADTSSRPAGARAARVFVTTYPDPVDRADPRDPGTA